MKRFLQGLVFLSGLFLVAPLSIAQEDIAEPHPAMAVVEHLQAGILESMRLADTTDPQVMHARIKELVLSTHDLDFILTLTLGRYWKQISEAEQLELSRLFCELSVTTYMARFDTYNGEEFVIEEGSIPVTGQYLVKSRLMVSSGDAIPFDYHLKLNGDQWMIINIIADNVSDLALKRAEYSRLMRGGGYPTLSAELKLQIANNWERINGS